MPLLFRLTLIPPQPIETLFFDGNDLTGTLPTELGNLVQLRNLALVGLHDITGTVPSELIALTRLEELYLLQMVTVDPFPIPEVVTLATNLRYVHISGSSVTGSLPMMAHLSHLQDFNLKFLSLTGTLPTEIGMLTELTLLSIDDSNIRGTVPSEIGLLTKLTKLEIRHESKITGGIPSEFGSLTVLERLDVSRTGMEGTIPEEICALIIPSPVSFDFDRCTNEDLNLDTGCFWDSCGR